MLLLETAQDLINSKKQNLGKQSQGENLGGGDSDKNGCYIYFTYLYFKSINIR